MPLDGQQNYCLVEWHSVVFVSLYGGFQMKVEDFVAALVQKVGSPLLKVLK